MIRNTVKMQKGKRNQNKEWIFILHRVILLGLIEKVRLSETDINEWVPYGISGERVFWEEGTVYGKDLRLERAWFVWEIPRVPVWLKQRERETNRRWSVTVNFVSTWLGHIVSRYKHYFLVCPWNISIWISGLSNAYIAYIAFSNVGVHRTVHWGCEWNKRQRKGEFTPSLPDCMS